MKHILTSLKAFWQDASNTRPAEQSQIPVITVRSFRGALALKRDRSQHRRYTAHYEDLQN